MSYPVDAKETILLSLSVVELQAMKVNILLLFLLSTLLTRAQGSYEIKGTDEHTTGIKKCGQSCLNSNCKHGKTCQLDDEDSYYECRKCVHNRKYFNRLQSNEIYYKIEECVKIKMSCQCPECPPTAPKPMTHQQNMSLKKAVGWISPTMSSSPGPCSPSPS